ncbi:MAG TPA: ribose-phosphate pyrophosphokinase [Anaerolineae bacterium]|nr:ribose-phosphate pyrophosphokinase [Anaerolineae bacterium]
MPKKATMSSALTLANGEGNVHPAINMAENGSDAVHALATPPSESYKLYGDLAIYSGTAHKDLAQKVAGYLGVSLGGADVFQFANSNTFVRLHESVRGKDVFLIQPTSPPTNDNLMELLIFIDTLRRDSAGRITAVVPFYGYGRTDKKDQPRVPITARLVADLLATAGADRFLTVDLHAGQIQGFFSIPTDELPARHLFFDYFRQQQCCPDDTVVVSPDIGGVRRARDLAERLGLPLAIIEKRRSQDGKETTMYNVIGDVQGKNVIIVDDEIDTAGTLTDAARFLRKAGAQQLIAAATHAVLSKPAAKRLSRSEISQLVVTDTVPISPKKRERIGDRLNVISVAPLVGDVIRRIHEGKSVGELFNE